MIHIHIQVGVSYKKLPRDYLPPLCSGRAPYYDGVLNDVCSALGVKPRRIDPLPERAHRYLRAAVAAATRASRPDPVVGRGPLQYGAEAIQFMEAPAGKDDSEPCTWC